jgi:nicotinamide mononucleotide transporter
MTPIEGVAAVTSLVSVVLAARASWLTWPTGIVGVIAYAWLFWIVRLYADLGLQAVFLVQSVYGWHLWRKGVDDENQQEQLPIRGAVWSEVTGTAVFLAAGIPLLTLLLQHYTNAAVPLADSTLSMLSLAATFLLARKIIANWPTWIVADVGYVFLFVYKGLVTSAVLYFIFLLICVKGWVHWKNLAAEEGQGSFSATRRATA